MNWNALLAGNGGRLNAITSAPAKQISIETEGFEFAAELTVPAQAEAVVIFAHGGGSSRKRPRNVFVAERLQAVGLGTLLLDLLTPEEENNYANRFDIALLSRRLNAAMQWLDEALPTANFPLGIFGTGTSAAAALSLAACERNKIQAVVSHGGRPDLIGRYGLSSVKAPTLLIVGAADRYAIELNRLALRHLGGKKSLEIVNGVTDLFEEPATLDKAAVLAARWFMRYLR